MVSKISETNNLFTAEEYKIIMLSREYYYKKNFLNDFFYEKINNIFPFIFKNKVNEFYSNTKAFRQYYKTQQNFIRQRIIMALALDDFTVNHLSHYKFNIDGVEYVYSITNIYDLFDEVNVIKNRLKEKHKSTEHNKSSDIKSNVLKFIKKDNT